MFWYEVYEHDEFGEIAITWDGEQGRRTHLVAIQADLWTPAEEVEACVRWARNLQYHGDGEGGDGGTSLTQE